MKIKVEEEDFWIDKVIEIHKKHGLDEINILRLREISRDAALEASEYLYKDYIANNDKVEGLGSAFGTQLEEFTVDEKGRAVGALFEMADRCQMRERDSTRIVLLTTEDVIEVSKFWDLAPHKLMNAFLKLVRLKD